jgi:hypothetical protein
MVKETEIIKLEIETFKNENGGVYSDYYIGITNSPERRLVEDVLNEHLHSGKYKEGAPYYCAESESRAAANKIELYFQDKNMQGYNPPAKGIEESKFVYCFKLNDKLNEEKTKMKHLMNYNKYSKEND